MRVQVGGSVSVCLGVFHCVCEIAGCRGAFNNIGKRDWPLSRDTAKLDVVDRRPYGSSKCLVVNFSREGPCPTECQSALHLVFLLQQEQGSLAF